MCAQAMTQTHKTAIFSFLKQLERHVNERSKHTYLKLATLQSNCPDWNLMKGLNRP